MPNPTAKSIANLRPAGPGNNRNPNGRKGKDGKGGFSLKTSFKKYLNGLDPADIERIWAGLLYKAQEGGVKEIELWFKINDERLDPEANKVAGEGEGSGPNIIINIPAVQESQEPRKD